MVKKLIFKVFGRKIRVTKTKHNFSSIADIIKFAEKGEYGSGRIPEGRVYHMSLQSYEISVGQQLMTEHLLISAIMDINLLDKKIY